MLIMPPLLLPHMQVWNNITWEQARPPPTPPPPVSSRCPHPPPPPPPPPTSVERICRRCQGLLPLLLHILQRGWSAAVRGQKHKPLPRTVSLHAPPLAAPFLLIFYIDISSCHFDRGRYPHVPAAVDFVSTDDYTDMAAVKNARWFYNKFLYPKCGSDPALSCSRCHRAADASPCHSLAGSFPTTASCSSPPPTTPPSAQLPFCRTWTPASPSKCVCTAPSLPNCQRPTTSPTPDCPQLPRLGG